MEVYLRAFINYKQDNWVKLYPMAKFAYNNAKYTSTEETPFELNCRYHLRVFYEKDVDPYSRSKIANELTKELRNLMAAYRENLKHAQTAKTSP